jgi:hypothetical protein
MEPTKSDDFNGLFIMTILRTPRLNISFSNFSNFSLRAFISVFILVFSPLSYSAGVAYSYHVKEVRVDRSGLGFISFDRPLKASHNSILPTCTQPAYADSLAFNTKTAAGNAILAIALAAKVGNKTLHGVGSGSCSLYGVMENWNYGWVNK